jgi:phenylacetate-coenzyme A ligase PaaK-like adenylate-forming protein
MSTETGSDWMTEAETSSYLDLPRATLRQWRWLDTDMCIVELVDDDHRPVPRGIPSTKVIVTNLYNVTQPLIRYELTDTFVRRPDAAASANRP